MLDTQAVLDEYGGGRDLQRCVMDFHCRSGRVASDWYRHGRDNVHAPWGVQVTRPRQARERLAEEANVLTLGAETRALAEAVHIPRSRTRARH